MRNKKLYYLPGVISIIGLPVLLFFWGPSSPVQQNVIGINQPWIEKGNTVGSMVTPAALYASIKEKEIIALDLNDLVWNDQSAYLLEQKFDFIDREIQRLQFTNDTAFVLKIGFGMKNNYGSLVRVLNIAILYDLRKYAFIDDNLYLFPNAPVRPRYASISLPMLSTMEPKYTLAIKWAQFKKTASHQFQYLFYRQQQNRALLAGFLFFILLPAAFAIRKYIRESRLQYAINQQVLKIHPGAAI